MRKMRQNKHCRPGAAALSARGFTLIEIMIVFAVMGIVIAFAGPRVAGGLMGMDTRTAVLKTAAMLRYARSKAVNTGCRYYMIFDGTARRVILRQGPCGDTYDRQSSDGAADPLAGGDGTAGSGEAETEMKEYPLPDRVFFERVVIAGIDSAGTGADVMMLTFYPSGMSHDAVVTIADERGRRFFISVAGIAGDVRVNEEQDDA